MFKIKTVMGLMLISILSMTSCYSTPKTNEYNPEEYVFLIRDYNSQMDQQGSGTAFLMRHNQRLVLVTAAHICENFLGPSVFKPLIATKHGMLLTSVMAVDIENEVCLLEAPPELYRLRNGLMLASKHAKPGEALETIGFPAGQFKLIVHALQAGRREFEMDSKQLNLEALGHFAIPGQSGSPVLNAKKQVIGVLIIRYYDVSLYTSLESLRDILDKNLPPPL